jgi:D-lactate dehydrogenase
MESLQKTKLVVFSAKQYDRFFFDIAASESNGTLYDIEYLDFALCSETASLARGYDAVCVFVNDTLDKDTLKILYANGVRAILLRCAGFNHVDLVAAGELGLFVAHVPAYSPEAVAEFAIALVQTLNRKTHRAFNRVREANFNIEGLIGTTLNGKTVGIVGVGRIGLATARIFNGFGCNMLAYDVYENPDFARFGTFVDLERLLAESDIISLHCPLTDSTRHLINTETLSTMKPGALLVNTSRGGLIDSQAVLESLKSHHLGGLALDVYEAERGLFYNDHSGKIIDDDVLMRLLTFPNVLICSHQGFFTKEALTEIANVTFANLRDFIERRPCPRSLVAGGRIDSSVKVEPVRL